MNDFCHYYYRTHNNKPMCVCNVHKHKYIVENAMCVCKLQYMVQLGKLRKTYKYFYKTENSNQHKLENNGNNNN